MVSHQTARGAPLAALAEQRWSVPWLISMVVHLMLFLALAIAVNRAPPRGGRVDLVASFTTGDDDASQGDAYDDTDNASGGIQAVMTTERLENATSSQAAGSTTLAALLDEPPPVDPTGVLPSQSSNLGTADLDDGGLAGTSGQTGTLGTRGGPGGPGAGTGQGPGLGRTRTSIFGVPGEGAKFVYVFDRSGSTGGPGRNTLSAAKAQLAASLNDLDRVHQFQIIFYNETPSVFNPTGQPGKLVFANERNKTLAERFIHSITSDGGTAHEEALTLAIRMRPDVIFFLTDADEPRLSARQLDKIQRMADGIVINAIEFGIGPQADPNDFMVRLARQNGGRFGYIDITGLNRPTHP